MRPLPKPNFDGQTTYQTCRESVRDPGLAARLESVTPQIVLAAQTYAVSGDAGTLFSILPSNDIEGVVTTDEMRALYKGAMSRSRARGRPIYDAIRAGAIGGICPLCGQRDASTLDHYLPQSKHPTLTVLPLNLVPACSDCNKAKRDIQPREFGEQTLHPYFDRLPAEAWLHATVVPGERVVVRYAAEAPNSWHEAWRARVKRHFDTFELGRLYGTHAASELVNIRYGLMSIGPTLGAEGIRGHLAVQAESRRQAFINSWQSALYAALAGSEWFCQEGYTRIG